MNKQDTDRKAAREARFIPILDAALAAGDRAGQDCVPTPVQFRTDNEIFPVEFEGNCGFAWVVVKPATSSFVRWLKSIADADDRFGFHKCYRGGYEIWPRGFGQSHDRKVAWASAVASRLTTAGFRAYAGDRLD